MYTVSQSKVRICNGCGLKLTSATVNDVQRAALEQTHAALKQHSMALEAALAERASFEVESDSATRDEIGRRDQRAAELTERVEELEQSLSKERQTSKDVRAQVCNLGNFSTSAIADGTHLYCEIFSRYFSL